MTCSEEWRPVKGFPRYEVSNLGRVRAFHYLGNEPNKETP